MYQDYMDPEYGALNPTVASSEYHPQHQQPSLQSPAAHHHQQQQLAGGYLVGMESPVKGKAVSKNHSLLPVTIRQLYSATQTHPDDAVFRIDGHELNEVTIVGQILSRKDGQTTITFHIDDGTGAIYAKVWVGENDEETQQRHQHLREGMYVRAIGQLRAFNTQRNLVAFRVRAVSDFNEITFHFLEVIYTHAVNTGILKLFSPPALSSSLYNSSSLFSASSNTNLFYRAPQLDTGLTPLQRAILELTRMSPPSGIKIDEICQRLVVQGHRVEDIKRDVEKLFQEGALYTTISEDHYKSN
jgi:replication factor A2